MNLSWWTTSSRSTKHTKTPLWSWAHRFISNTETRFSIETPFILRFLGKISWEVPYIPPDHKTLKKLGDSRLLPQNRLIINTSQFKLPDVDKEHAAESKNGKTYLLKYDQSHWEILNFAKSKHRRSQIDLVDEKHYLDSWERAQVALSFHNYALLSNLKAQACQTTPLIFTMRENTNTFWTNRLVCKLQFIAILL